MESKELTDIIQHGLFHSSAEVKGEVIVLYGEQGINGYNTT
jgi:hypothetical protein